MRRFDRCAVLVAILASGCAAPPAATELTLVSYNIQAGTDLAGQPSLVRVATVLDSLGADIVLLQEVDRGVRRSGGEDQLAVLEQLTGFHGAFARSLGYQGGDYGIAVLSRWPITAHRTLPLPASPPAVRAGGSTEPRVGILAEIAWPAGPLHVINVHVGAEAEPTSRRQEILLLLAHARRDVPAGEPLVLGGDLNARPGTPEIDAVAFALTDAWEACGDGGPGHTFRADRPDRRIDYIFLRGLECSAAFVHPTTASDHLPLVVRARLVR